MRFVPYGAASAVAVSLLGCTGKSDSMTVPDASMEASDTDGATLPLDDATLPGDAQEESLGDAGCPLYELPPDDPARSVSFILTNASDAGRYLVTSGQGCRPFTIDDFDPAASPTTPVSVCTDVIGDAGNGDVGFTYLPPDGSTTVTWDGLKPVPYEALFLNSGAWACIYFGFTADQCLLRTFTMLKAVSGLSHVAAFGVATAPPSVDGGSCAGRSGGVGTPSYRCDPRCEAAPATTLTVPFDLPDSGPVTINVSIP
jgi:hypothetical protein